MTSASVDRTTSSALAASREALEEPPRRRRQLRPVAPPVTQSARPPLPALEELPATHKIVVLGATGRVGAAVVRSLLDGAAPPGSLVVAVVRDYDKACRVLYDDMVLLASSSSSTSSGSHKAPRLQIVEAEVVARHDWPVVAAPPRDQNDDDDAADQAWRARAASAARFYGTSVGAYDDGRVTDDDDESALAQVWEGCTAIISCLASVRTTRPWPDWWRLLWQPDVRRWCGDRTHPYFTHYDATRHVLQGAAREQARREVLYQAQAEVDDDGTDEADQELLQVRHTNRPPRRIRLVRLSDLVVTQQPWHLVPLLTNAFRSMVVRYHEMADALVAASDLLDTVVVRPGELVDDERDEDLVAVQVQVDDYQLQNQTAAAAATLATAPEDVVTTPSCDWSPARVGRDDVAAVLAAVAVAPWLTDDATAAVTAVHYTLAVRWAGDAQAMAPYPAQGSYADGCQQAAESLQKAVQTRRKQGPVRTTDARALWCKWSRKPYGLCVAIPLYLALALVLRKLGRAVFFCLASSRQGAPWMAAPVALWSHFHWHAWWQAVGRFCVRKAPAVQYISF
jgi:hypothetical protein